ncbi:hypothetical protein D3C81_1470750 [compost metagenome]
MTITWFSRSVLTSSWLIATEILMIITRPWAIRPTPAAYSRPMPSAAPRTRPLTSCARSTPASSTSAAPNTFGRYSASMSRVAETRSRPRDSAAETRKISNTNQ